MANTTYQFAGPPLIIPPDFLGMCNIEYPVSGTNPVGLLSWKSNRLIQDGLVFWAAIETSPGTYNWTTLDSIVTFQRQNGATVYFGMYGTPTFYAQTAANPTYADNVTKGPFGFTGEGSFPTSLTAVANFCAAAIQRYNLPGGAWFNTNGATLGKGIQYWEAWNEPTYTGNGNVSGPGLSGTGYFWGTAPQLVDLCWTQYTTIKSLDPSVLVSSPGFQGPPAAIAATFFNTAGAVNTTKTGRDCCDEIAFHNYGTTPPWTEFGTYVDDAIFGSAGLQTVRNWCRRNNVSKPWRVSEWGIDSNAGSATNLSWYSQTAAFRYKWMLQCLMAHAAQGVRAIYPFNWNETLNTSGNSGNWQGDTNGVQKAFNDFATNCLGKRLESATYDLVLRRLTFNFSNGSTFSA